MSTRLIIRLAMPFGCLIGLLIGSVIFLSPIFITGGIFGRFDDVEKGAAWIGVVMATIASVVIGLAVIVISGIIAVASGFVFATESYFASKSQRLLATEQTNSAPAESRLVEKPSSEADPSGSTVLNHELLIENGGMRCCYCGKPIFLPVPKCPYCNKLLKQTAKQDQT